MGTKPTISVVSLTWNSARFIEPLLTTLLADIQASGVPTEIIMIDNGSSRDNTVEQIQGFMRDHDNIHLVPLSKNHGTTASRNIGIRMARGEYVLILDSDTEMPKGTLRGLVNAMSEIPEPDKIGIIHPRLTFPDGEFQESARRFPTIFTKAYRLLRMEDKRVLDESIPSVISGAVTPVDYAISACWFVPRAVFDKVGLLDESIFYSPEDVEFCARLWQHGYRVWYYPKCHVVHNCQRLTSKKPISKLGLSHMKGLFRYWWQYKYVFNRPSIDQLGHLDSTTRSPQ